MTYVNEHVAVYRIEFHDLPEHINLDPATLRLDLRDKAWAAEAQVRFEVWDQIMPFVRPKPLPSPDYIPDVTVDMATGSGVIEWEHGGRFTMTKIEPPRTVSGDGQGERR